MIITYYIALVAPSRVVHSHTHSLTHPLTPGLGSSLKVVSVFSYSVLPIEDDWKSLFGVRASPCPCACVRAS